MKYLHTYITSLFDSRYMKRIELNFYLLEICRILVLNLEGSSFFNWTMLHFSLSFLTDTILTVISLINPAPHITYRKGNTKQY